MHELCQFCLYQHLCLRFILGIDSKSARAGPYTVTHLALGLKSSGLEMNGLHPLYPLSHLLTQCYPRWRQNGSGVDVSVRKIQAY